MAKIRWILRRGDNFIDGDLDSDHHIVVRSRLRLVNTGNICSGWMKLNEHHNASSWQSMMSLISSPDNPVVSYLQIFWYPLLSNEGSSVWSRGRHFQLTNNTHEHDMINQSQTAMSHPWAPLPRYVPTQVTMSLVITNSIITLISIQPPSPRWAKCRSWEQSN